MQGFIQDFKFLGLVDSSKWKSTQPDSFLFGLVFGVRRNPRASSPNAEGIYSALVAYCKEKIQL